MLALRVATALVVVGAAPAFAQKETGDDVPATDVPDVAMPEIDTSGLDDGAPDVVPPEPDVVPPEPDPVEPPTPSLDEPPLPTTEQAPPPRDPRGGFTSYIEGLTYSPTLAPLSFSVLPTSQSFFDSYIPVFGDEGAASGLWLGYQGAGVAGLATMGLALAGNALFQFPNDVDVSVPLAAGGFNDRSLLSVGQGLLGVYGRAGPVSVALGGAGALESVPVVVGQKHALGYGLGGAAELAFEFSEDNHVIARAAATQLTAFDSAQPSLVKVDPLLGVMLSVFGTPVVVGVGAAFVLGEGREPVVAPRLFLGGGFDGDHNDPRPSAAPPLPSLPDEPGQPSAEPSVGP